MVLPDGFKESLITGCNDLLRNDIAQNEENQPMTAGKGKGSGDKGKSRAKPEGTAGNLIE